MNDFSIESKTFNTKLLKALKKHQLNIQAMKYSNSFFTKKRNWGAYINFIKIWNVLIVPIYGIKEDILALEELQNIYKNCLIEPITFGAIIKESGALHCVSSEKIGV
jgi:agmatine/peptidylarginine deiminase